MYNNEQVKCLGWVCPGYFEAETRKLGSNWKVVVGMRIGNCKTTLWHLLPTHWSAASRGTLHYFLLWHNTKISTKNYQEFHVNMSKIQKGKQIVCVWRCVLFTYYVTTYGHWHCPHSFLMQPHGSCHYQLSLYVAQCELHNTHLKMVDVSFNFPSPKIIPSQSCCKLVSI